MSGVFMIEGKFLVVLWLNLVLVYKCESTQVLSCGLFSWGT